MCGEKFQLELMGGQLLVKTNSKTHFIIKMVNVLIRCFPTGHHSVYLVKNKNRLKRPQHCPRAWKPANDF